MTADPAEVSLLHFLYLVRSADGLNRLLAVEGGYQQDRIEGGAQAMANRMATDLGDALRLGAPVREIAQDADGVRIAADGAAVHAKRAIVAVPPALAARINYDPAAARRPRAAHRAHARGLDPQGARRVRGLVLA